MKKLKITSVHPSDAYFKNKVKGRIIWADEAFVEMYKFGEMYWSGPFVWATPFANKKNGYAYAFKVTRV